MINDSNIGGLMGAPVLGPDGHKIGTVGQVFIDPDTGMPNWITVHTGLFGRRESFVPLNDAIWDNEVLRVPVGKDVIKDAPHVETEEALTPENEAGLYRYYKMATTDADEPVPETAHPRLRRYVVSEQESPPEEVPRNPPDPDSHAPRHAMPD